jgi:hypothetical protein
MVVEDGQQQVLVQKVSMVVLVLRQFDLLVAVARQKLADYLAYNLVEVVTAVQELQTLMEQVPTQAVVVVAERVIVMDQDKAMV